MASTSIPTTSFSASAETSIPPPWKPGCARHSTSWPKGPAAPGKTKLNTLRRKPGYYLVSKEDVNQSTIHMVGLGTTRDNPDYYAISVFNEAFGGGFSSRLFNDIRTKRGLAYSVGGGIGTQLRPSRHSAGGDRHQERNHHRSHSGRRRRHRQISPSSPSPMTKSSAPKTPSSTPSSFASTRPTKFSASA